MKKILTIIILMICICTMSSCTEQGRTRVLGGTSTIDVEPGYRVMMATWKESDLFYMVEEMPDDYVPHDKILVESSSWGVLESTIIFKESRTNENTK